jgi:hypothetical protein
LWLSIVTSIGGSGFAGVAAVGGFASFGDGAGAGAGGLPSGSSANAGEATHASTTAIPMRIIARRYHRPDRALAHTRGPRTAATDSPAPGGSAGAPL